MVVGMLVSLAVQLALWLLVPFPPTDGNRVLLWLFHRRDKSPVAPVDAGALVRVRPATSAAWVTLVVLVAIGGIVTAGAGLVVMIGLLRRRASW